MATNIYITSALEHVEEEVKISGWLYNKTHKGKLIFLMIRDGTGIIQGVIFKNDIPEETFEKCLHLPQESSLELTGKVVADKRAKGGAELQVK
ncbi:MAG: asparagine--tRNA ligase, partial [Actinobacteria bacterium]|nr:asparagine--tRNA ligase [Actinomycetota bacterium]